MERLSNTFTNAHDFVLSLPNRAVVLEIITPQTMTNLCKSAEEKGITRYDAFAGEVKARLERFIETHTDKPQKLMFQAYEFDPSQRIYIPFNLAAEIASDVHHLNNSVKELFTDIPVIPNIPGKDIGHYMEVAYG